MSDEKAITPADSAEGPRKSGFRWRTGLLILAGLLIVGFLLFAFGNPQWNKYIFIFQGYGLKKDLTPPEGFTGTWRGWARNGELGAERQYRNGELHGTVVSYYSNGIKGYEISYRNGLRHGFEITRNEDGTIKNRAEYRDGDPWDGLCYIRDMKGWVGIYKQGKPWTGCLPVRNEALGKTDWRYFDNGKELSKEDYCQLHKIPQNARVIGLWYVKE